MNVVLTVVIKNDKKVAGTPNHVNGKPLIGNKIIASDRRNQNPGKSQQTIAENENTSHDGKTPVSKNDFSTGRKKVTLVGDSMTKFVRREELSSKQNNVKVLTHPGSTTADMVDYIKPIVRRKPDALVIHTGTNDMTNDVNALKYVRKLVKIIREIDVDKEIKIGFPSVTCRTDKNLEQERMEINTKLKKYCEGKGFIFVENNNINESGLNNSKLHLNKKGTMIFSQNIKNSLHHF